MSETTPNTTPNPTGGENNNIDPNTQANKDGGEGDDDEDEEPGDPEKAPITLADFKKYKSDVERGVQKLMDNHRKDAELKEKVLDGIQIVMKDQEKLIDIYKDSPAAAKVILDKYYDGISIEDFQMDYLGYEKPKIKTQVDEEEIIRKHEEKKQGAQMTERFDSWIGELETAWLTQEQIDQIKEEYSDIVWRRVLDEAKQKKIFRSAYYAIIGQSPEDKTAKVVKQTAAGGAWGQQKSSKNTDPYADASIKFLIDQGILTAPKKS